ncbi:O-antigen ligase family protein [Lewinella cohaerens]|uniref:O-antigen ligase family protein n=1 Tax=Lewinella cohaerens TaxID=70995 RepID=UPI000380B67A|nr:O-antigen ligase family protein [Lewinella cohaerens]
MNEGIKKLLGPPTYQFIGVLALLFILVGLVVSSAMMSMGVIGLAIVWVLNPDVKKNIQTLLKHPVFWSIVLLFLVWGISGLWSENTDYWANRMRMRLPFLLMPAGLLAIPKFDRSVYYPLLYIFYFLLSAICLYLFAWYLLHFSEMTLAYKKGQVLPTPVMHIRFSLMVAYCVAIGITFLQEKWTWRYKWERAVQFFITGFLIVFLHVLAVRSGLVALYGVLFYFLIREIILRRRWWFGIITTLLLVGGMATAYLTIPSLQNKIDYTLYNIYNIRHDNNRTELSDSHRVGTIQAGLAMGNEAPFLGVGIGDIRDETEVYLKANYPGVAGSGFTPQSQYVWQYAGVGWFGLLVFIVVTFLPLFYKKGWQYALLGSFLAIAIPSFIIEQTLETQLGTAIYLTFLLMAARFYLTGGLSDQKENDRGAFAPDVGN